MSKSKMNMYKLNPNYKYFLNLILFCGVFSGFLFFEAVSAPVKVNNSSDLVQAETNNLSNLYEHVSEISKEYESKYDVKVLKSPKGFAIHMTMGKLFRPGKATFDVDSERYFYKYITALRLHTQNVNVEVEGYSDPNPVEREDSAYPTNWEISTARASFIGRLFIDAGLNKSNLKISGRGDSKPLEFTDREIASIDEYSRKIKQRRVIIYVTPSS